MLYVTTKALRMKLCTSVLHLFTHTDCVWVLQGESIKLDPELEAKCRDDVQQFCSNVNPGNAAVSLRSFAQVTLLKDIPELGREREKNTVRVTVLMLCCFWGCRSLINLKCYCLQRVCELLSENQDNVTGTVTSNWQTHCVGVILSDSCLAFLPGESIFSWSNCSVHFGL